MDTPKTNDWRLERWIALLLSLLYLLPFVARAESYPPIPADAAALMLLSTDDGSWTPAVTLSSEWDVTVTGSVARATLRQRFRNESSSCVEGIYVLPLPDSAAVDSLRIHIGDRVIEGVVRERDAARVEYDAARREGRSAALLEQFRPNVFRISIASILPGEEALVITGWQQPLEVTATGGSLRIPTTLARRFEPTRSGAPALPEEMPLPSMMLSSDPTAAPATVRVSLMPGLPLESISSPSHPSLETAVDGPLAWSVSVAMRPANREFVLRWTFLPGAEPRPSLITGTHAGERWSLLTLVPPLHRETAALQSRDLLLVLDTSGSMHGPALEQSRAAVLLALDRLTTMDRFQIVTFSDSWNALFDESEPAHPAALERARAFVTGLRADGGTMMKAPLEYAMASDDGFDAVRQIVFITDGQVGNEREILHAVQRNAGRSRLYTVSLGPAPNAGFLRAMARFGRGTFTPISDLDEVAVNMGELLRKLESPLLTDIELVGASAGAEIFPERIGDLHHGDPVTIAIRGDVGPLQLRGNRGKNQWSSGRIAPTEVHDATSLAKLWGRRKLEALEDSIIGGADPETVRGSTVRTAMEIGLLSSWTSLIAVDSTPDGARESCNPSVIASATPDGWSGSLPATATWWPLLAAIATCLLAAGARLAGRG